MIQCGWFDLQYSYIFIVQDSPQKETANTLIIHNSKHANSSILQKLLLVSTHLKHISQIGSFPQNRGEHEKIFETTQSRMQFLSIISGTSIHHIFAFHLGILSSSMQLEVILFPWFKVNVTIGNLQNYQFWCD